MALSSGKHLASVMLCAVAASGCMTARPYEGPRRPRSEVAHIIGDLAMTSANLPVSVILRQVDGITLRMGQNAVDVLPGSHVLLVDCRVVDSGSLTRHEIEVEVREGRVYRLVPVTGPGARECDEVRLELQE